MLTFQMLTFNKRYLSPALMLTLLPAMFRFGAEGISWFWGSAPIVPAVLLATAAVFWVLCFKSRGRAA